MVDRLRGGLQFQVSNSNSLDCHLSTRAFTPLRLAGKKNQILAAEKSTAERSGRRLSIVRPEEILFSVPFLPSESYSNKLLRFQHQPSGGKSADCGGAGGRNNGAAEGRASGRDSRADGGPLAAAPRAGRPLRGRPPGPCRATVPSPRRSGVDRISGLGSAGLALGFCFLSDRSAD